MEKRVLFAISLSFVVLFAYQMLVPKPAAKPLPRPPVAGAAATVGQSKTPASTAPAPGTPGAPATPALEKATAAAASARVADTAERDVVVDTPSVHAVFSNRGALLKSWTLK